MLKYFVCTSLVLIIQLISLSAIELSCQNLETLIANSNSPFLHPYCDNAEISCKAMDIMQKRPLKDPLRLRVEPQLQKETRYLLDLCAMATETNNSDLK